MGGTRRYVLVEVHRLLVGFSLDAVVGVDSNCKVKEVDSGGWNDIEVPREDAVVICICLEINVPLISP